MNIYVIIFILLCIIGGVIVYYMYRPNPNKFVPNNEYTDNKNTEIQLILFYVTWCPHSQKALADWEKMKSNISSANSKYIIDFNTIDCEKESELAKTYNVTEYPTIFLVRGLKKYEYDANLSEDTLNLFINTVMKK